MDICPWLSFLIYLIQLAHHIFPDLLTMDIGQPDLLLLICQFLIHIMGPNSNASQSDVSNCHYPHFLIKSLSINQPSLLSMHLVIFVASRACIMNGYMLHHHGKRVHHSTIPFLLRWVQTTMACKELMLPRSSYFYPFAMMALNTAVCQWIGFLVLGIVQMKTLVCGSLNGTVMPMDIRSHRWLI